MKIERKKIQQEFVICHTSFPRIHGDQVGQGKPLCMASTKILLHLPQFVMQIQHRSFHRETIKVLATLLRNTNDHGACKISFIKTNATLVTP